MRPFVKWRCMPGAIGLKQRTRGSASGVDGGPQEKVLAQVQRAPKPKAKPAPKAAKGPKGAKGAKEPEEEEEVDPVEEALSKYGIIMSNPWDKKTKCAPCSRTPAPAPAALQMHWGRC